MTCLIDIKLFKNNEIYYNFNKINATLKKEENYKILTFDLENIKNMYKIYDNGCILYRNNDEFEFKLDTIKNESTYLLKEVDRMFDINVKSCEYKKIDNKIIINYELETDDNYNRIELVIGEIE